MRDETEEAPRLRVVIADPDPLTRRVVRDELQSRDAFVVVAEAADGVEALELCRHYEPELLVSEVTLPRVDGVEVTRQLRLDTPGLRVVVFTIHDDEATEMRALRAGAGGYLPKASGVPAVAQALLAVARGEAAISRVLTMRLIERLRRLPEAGQGVRPIKSVLTDREWEVLDLLVAGASTRDIADGLFLTDDTVYSHIKSILRKLGVRSRDEAIAAARGMVDLSLTG
jgi:two-component system, NarL family, response regulator LiaR